MKNAIVVLLIVLFALGANCTTHAQRIKVIHDSTTQASRYMSKVFYGPQQQTYLASYNQVGDTATIEELFPVRRIIKKFPADPFTPDSSSYAVDYAIAGSRACIVYGKFKLHSTQPRIVLIDLSNGAIIKDTLLHINRGAYFIFSPQAVIADTMGNFYCNLEVYDSTQSNPLAYLKIATNNAISLHICDSIKTGLTSLVSVAGTEATHLAPPNIKMVMRSSCGSSTASTGTPFSQIHRVYSPQYAKAELTYMTDSGMYSYIGLLQISSDTIQAVPLHVDSLTQWRLIDFVPTYDTSVFSLWKSASGSWRVRRQNAQDGLVMDTTLSIPHGKTLVDHRYYEHPRGSLFGIQTLADSTSNESQRLVEIAREPGKPTVHTSVNNQGLQATIRCNAVKDGGINVSSYVIEYKMHSASTWTQQTTLSDSMIISGLIAQEQYDVRVQAVNELGVSPVSDIVSFTITGNVGIMENALEDGMQIYPNPVKAGETFHLDADQIAIYTLTGELVSETMSAPYQPGLYFVRLVNDGSTRYLKLIVE